MYKIIETIYNILLMKVAKMKYINKGGEDDSSIIWKSVYL